MDRFGRTFSLIGKLSALLLVFIAEVSFATDWPEKLVVQSMAKKDKIALEFHGKKNDQVKIFFFWASWCEYCKELAREINGIYLKNSERFKFIGLSVDEKKRDAKKVAGTTYRNLPENYWIPKKTLEKLGLEKYPIVVLVNKNGQIDTVYEGSESDKINYLRKRLFSLEKSAGSDLDKM